VETLDRGQHCLHTWYFWTCYYWWLQF